jgi:hypothetical protein
VVIQRLFSHPSNATLQRASEGTPESLRKKEHSWNVDELFRMATESGKRGWEGVKRFNNKQKEGSKRVT